MSKYTIGIDLGGTTMTAGLVNEKFEVVGKVTWATRLPRPAQDLEKALADLCRTVARENKVDFADIRYVGIGTPGSVNFTTGFVGFNTNFGYYDWNLGPDMENLLGCKVYVENDANAAAFGEYIAGGAKGYRDAVIITLGTGIGSGIILNGKILRGFNFAAGEMGHNVIVKDGIQCTCGRKGCWERYASASALTRETKKAMQENKNTIMWQMTQDIDHVNAKLAFDAAAKGDETAQKVVDSWIEYVGVGIANVINTFEPEVICIGGGVSNQGEVLLAPVRAYAENETRNITTGKFPAICACTLRNDAGVTVCQLRRRVEQRIAGRRIFCDDRRFLVDKGKVCLLNQRSDRLISGEEVIVIVGLCLPVDDIVNEVIPDCQQGGVCRRSRRLRRVSRFSLFRFRRGLHRRRLHFDSARGTSAQQSDCQQAGKEMFESHSAPPFTQGTARLPLPQHR